MAGRATLDAVRLGILSVRGQGHFHFCKGEVENLQVFGKLLKGHQGQDQGN